MRARAGVHGMSGWRSASRTKTFDMVLSLLREAPVRGPRWLKPKPQTGNVFLAPVHERPSSRCTGSASPFTCLTSGLESFRLERPPEGPRLGTPHERLLELCSGGCSALGLAHHKPPGFPVGSL